MTRATRPASCAARASRRRDSAEPVKQGLSGCDACAKYWSIQPSRLDFTFSAGPEDRSLGIRPLHPPPTLMPAVSTLLPPPPRLVRDDAPPRRIALFTGNYHHVQDGVSLTLNRLVAYLQERGDEVLVFGPTVDDPPMEHVGRLIAAPSMPAPGRPEYRVALRFSRTIRHQLEDFQPDLVHIATPDYLGYRALRWAKAHDVPVVASYHTHFPAYLKYYGIQSLEGFLWKYNRWFYGQCEHVYVPSLSVAAVLRVHG